MPYTDSMSKINNAQVHNAKDLDVVVLCRCIIYSNIVMIIQNYQEVYENNSEMSQLMI